MQNAWKVACLRKTADRSVSWIDHAFEEFEDESEFNDDHAFEEFEA